ncbi:cystathionine beta-lyase [Citrobacter koseri]|uniref:Cystathionine beta-lyase n=1 Tax=Citrobacter koseri TaxID=545 RepID=A0A2X2XJL6_CITKO|nr:cystathionine beta-lyase [Citrobacter koseri]
MILANQPEELNSIRPAGDVDFSGTLVRVHIGLEDVGDLIADLDARVCAYRLKKQAPYSGACCRRR